MRRYNFVLIVLVASLFPSAAVSIDNGTRFIHISPALCLDRGALYATSLSSAYFKHVTYPSHAAQGRGVTYWDLQGGISAYYGLSDRLELGLRQILYQDNHKESPGFNLPDDLFISAKLGNVGPADGPFRLSGLVKARLPLAHYHNVVLEQYSAGRVELNATALISYYSNLSDRRNAFSIHLNIGVLNHNDVGKSLTDVPDDTISASLPSRQVLFGVAFSKNFYPFRFAVECTGNSLPRRPPATAYSRETFVYVTPSVSYQANSTLVFTAGMDVRLLNTADETDYQYSPFNDRIFDNYPPWRLYLRMQCNFTSHNRVIPAALALEVESAPQGHEEGDAPYVQQLAKEKATTETAEIELERIREERERVARILEKLKTMMEAKKKTPPPPPGEQ